MTDPALQALLDKQHIAELLTRYLRSVDRGDVATLRPCSSLGTGTPTPPNKNPGCAACPPPPPRCCASAPSSPPTPSTPPADRRHAPSPFGIIIADIYTPHEGCRYPRSWLPSGEPHQ